MNSGPCHGYRKSVYLVGDTWVPIVAPMACNYFALNNKGAGAVVLRSDPADAATEDDLPALGQEGPVAAFQADGPTSTRFAQGDVVMFVKSQDASPQRVTVTWVR